MRKFLLTVCAAALLPMAAFAQDKKNPIENYDPVKQCLALVTPELEQEFTKNFHVDYVFAPKEGYVINILRTNGPVDGDASGVFEILVNMSNGKACILSIGGLDPSVDKAVQAARDAAPKTMSTDSPFTKDGPVTVAPTTPTSPTAPVSPPLTDMPKSE
jgi:hypothetical protein